uniref:alpha-1,3-mannosyl-glycoprotein 2-beta-N-acetylglucosaminyltransferase n=1 Tax=Haptolina ericina TaxID=156174 RepID=A0A7S3AC40_9EUKA
MLFSPDFLSLFEQTAWLLQADPTVWCVSSWNDNGFTDLVSDADLGRLFRTDVFPGLGWMLRRELWEELSPKFPLEHWDHWMRLASTHKGRDCIAPLVSRNYNIGVQGANMDTSQYRKYLERIRHNKAFGIRLTEVRTALSAPYEAYLSALVTQAARQHRSPKVSPKAAGPSAAPVLYTYTTDNFAQLARHFGIWQVPRGTHRNTAVIRWRETTYVLASARWSPYLPPELREMPPVALSYVPAARGDSCTTACERFTRSAEEGGSGRPHICTTRLFEFANQVEQLAAHFPCEKGFATVTGPDIPNYVVDPTDQYSGRCLISEGGWTCAAKHAHTRRLCACLDPGIPEPDPATAATAAAAAVGSAASELDGMRGHGAFGDGARGDGVQAVPSLSSPPRQQTSGRTRRKLVPLISSLRTEDVE